MKKPGETILSGFSGIVLGATLAFWGPLLIAVIRNDHPIHSGPYFESMLILLATLPLLGGGTSGFLAWRGRWSKGLRVVRWVGLIALLPLIVIAFLFLR